MTALLASVCAIIILIVFFLLLSIVVGIYMWARKKLNKPKVGTEFLCTRLLERGDYVCIGEDVYRFSHFASRGESINPVYPPIGSNIANEEELFFDMENGLGYIRYSQIKFKRECKFISGKYGLKYADTEQTAVSAMKMGINKINEFYNNNNKNVYYEYYEIARLFPEVEQIHIKVTDTNAWPWNRYKEFSLGKGSKCNFHLDCPMSKCLGHNTGINYEHAISSMVYKKESHKQVHLTCGGYGGYNLTFHCDWYAVLDISITYRKP